MKSLIVLGLLSFFAVHPAIVIANEEADESVVSTEDTGYSVEEADAAGNSWHHVGCISQVNPSSSCRKLANKHGYSQSRYEQNYICPPKVFYSCYGR